MLATDAKTAENLIQIFYDGRKFQRQYVNVIDPHELVIFYVAKISDSVCNYLYIIKVKNCICYFIYTCIHYFCSFYFFAIFCFI